MKKLLLLIGLLLAPLFLHAEIQYKGSSDAPNFSISDAGGNVFGDFTEIDGAPAEFFEVSQPVIDEVLQVEALPDRMTEENGDSAPDYVLLTTRAVLCYPSERSGPVLRNFVAFASISDWAYALEDRPPIE